MFDELAAYTPNMPPERWQVLGEYAIEITRRTNGLVPYPPGTVLRAVAAYLKWCWIDAGLPLEDMLFDRRVIAHYIQTGCPTLTEAARGNRRSLLLRVQEIIAPQAGAQRLPALAASDPTKPYAPAELLAVLSWARSQSTAARRRNAHALIGIGLGAGLAAGEIMALRQRDVHHVDGNVDVDVSGPRARTVPVIEEWTPMIPQPEHDDGEFVFRPGRTMIYPNAISNFVLRDNRHGLGPQSQRLRTTWIVHHLHAGTPLRALVAAAGVDSLEAFDRYLEFVPAPDDGAQRLRRPGTP